MLLSTFYLALLTVSLAWNFLRHGRVAKPAPAGHGRYDPGPTAATARFAAAAGESSYQRWSWGAGGRLAGAYQPAAIAVFIALDLSRLAHEPRDIASVGSHGADLVGQDALRLEHDFAFGGDEDLLLATGLSLQPDAHDLALAEVSPMDHEAAVVWSALHHASHAAPLVHEGWIV